MTIREQYNHIRSTCYLLFERSEPKQEWDNTAVEYWMGVDGSRFYRVEIDNAGLWQIVDYSRGNVKYASRLY